VRGGVPILPELLVLAKAPVPGRSKTRLAPAFGAHGAAELAAAALQDTLEAVAAAPAGRRVLVLDGDLTSSPFEVAVPVGFEVVPQVAGGHGARIAAALGDCQAPAVLIGMDTPQLRPGLLELAPGHDAWLGRAEDGGWWALGLREPDRFAAAALEGVPMSTGRTGAAQAERLAGLGLRVGRLASLRDVDEPDDAVVVASQAPGTRFAAVHARLTSLARIAG
jgi:uncharacterized protein